MTNLVPEHDIEKIVGLPRHPTDHIGRAVSSEEMVYVMHSQSCKDTGSDLRLCDFSYAADEGINRQDWENYEDRPVRLRVTEDGWLIPSEL